MYIDKKRVAHRRGRRIRSISIGRLPAGRHTITVKTLAATGVRHVSVRKLNGCALSKPHNRRLRHTGKRKR